MHTYIDLALTRVLWWNLRRKLMNSQIAKNRGLRHKFRQCYLTRGNLKFSNLYNFKCVYSLWWNMIILCKRIVVVGKRRVHRIFLEGTIKNARWDGRKYWPNYLPTWRFVGELAHKHSKLHLVSKRKWLIWDHECV